MELASFGSIASLLVGVISEMAPAHLSSSSSPILSLIVVWNYASRATSKQILRRIESYIVTCLEFWSLWIVAILHRSASLSRRSSRSCPIAHISSTTNSTLLSPDYAYYWGDISSRTAFQTYTSHLKLIGSSCLQGLYWFQWPIPTLKMAIDQERNPNESTYDS